MEYGQLISNGKIADKEKERNKMKRCTKCVMPETWEGISFDENGVCSLCSEYAKKTDTINWDRRKELLKGIFQDLQG